MTIFSSILVAAIYADNTSKRVPNRRYKNMKWIIK